MQQKNLLLFMALSLLILISWFQFQNWMWPPPVRKSKPPETHVQLPDARLWAAVPADIQAAVSPVPAGSGIGSAAQLAVQAGLADWSARGWQTVARRPVEPPPVEKKAPEQPVVKAPTAPHRVIELGDDSSDSRFNFKVVLTSRGAAVQNLILNKFEQANRLGRPAHEPLHLIPNDPKLPSDILYHYAPTDEVNPEHPLDTLGKQEWTVRTVHNGDDDKVQEVVFATTLPALDVSITKTYTLEPGTYHLGLALRFERSAKSAKPLSFRYQLAGAHGLPIEGEWYTTIYRNAIAGLVDNSHRVWRDLQPSQTIAFQEGGHEILKSADRFIRFAGIATQYFASIIVVDDHQEAGVKQDFLAWGRPTIESENSRKPYLDDICMRVISEPIELKPGVPVVHKYLLYNGPVKVRLLAHLDGKNAVAESLVSRYEGEGQLGLGKMTDVGNFGIWTSLLIACTNFMHGLLWFLHSYVMPWSYGLCIILLTVMVRGAMFPFSRKQSIASARMQEKMAELAPEVKKLEEKFKGDTMALQQAKQKLYMDRGVNPMAMMGSCWMVFAQMPIFLGLYYALQESIYFRLAPFLWIQNLAAPDMLIPWGENIPIISQPDAQGSILYLGPFFNLLPIIAVVFMILQQKIMTPPPTDEQQAMQQKMMKYMMIFFGLMFYKVAAGLCLYFIASSLWGLCERKLLLPKRQPALAMAAANGRGGTGPARHKPKPMPANGDGIATKVKDWWETVLREARKK